jgi:DNA-binding CsgD family transcriptional regulator
LINIKNKQISSCFFELQQIRSSISNLESILKEIENVLPDDKKSLVNELQINIKKCLFVEKKWKNFHSYFEESQFRYHKTLLLRYNDLKPNDLKICSLLRLNLSIKESADILGISHDSLKASRYRLRKKLGLKPRESILNYLISLEKQNLNLNQNNFNH